MADSLRKDAIQGMVTTLAALTVALGYHYDYNGQGQVSKLMDTVDARRAGGQRLTVRVADGAETFVHRTLGTQRLITAQLEILIHAMLVVQTPSDIVDKLNDVVHDIHLAIDKTPRLGVSIVDAVVVEIDAPDYDIENSTAGVLIHVRADYDYQSGVSI